MASPFFKDLLSLPQPSDSEIVDGLPLVQLPEGSELLNCLFSILYPVSTATPSSYEKVPYTLPTCRHHITNRVLQGVKSTRRMSEIRDGFGGDIYPCRGQPRGISKAKQGQCLPRIRVRKCKKAHSGNGSHRSSDLEVPHDIRSSWRRTALVRRLGLAQSC
jgi:hypothetical protein